MEAERSEEDQERNKRQHNINVNNTPKARPGRPKGAKRDAAGSRKSSKIGERREIHFSFYPTFILFLLAENVKSQDHILSQSVDSSLHNSNSAGHVTYLE